MPKEEQRKIELSRQAALLIYKLKIGKITRAKVNSEVLKINNEDQEIFKQYLNKYRQLK